MLAYAGFQDNGEREKKGDRERQRKREGERQRERDRTNRFALKAEFSFISCQDYTGIYKNGKTLKGERNLCLRTKLRNHDYNKCFDFDSVKRERPECIKEIRVLLPSFMFA